MLGNKFVNGNVPVVEEQGADESWDGWPGTHSQWGLNPTSNSDFAIPTQLERKEEERQARRGTCGRESSGCRGISVWARVWEGDTQKADSQPRTNAKVHSEELRVGPGSLSIEWTEVWKKKTKDKKNSFFLSFCWEPGKYGFGCSPEALGFLPQVTRCSPGHREAGV